MSKYDRNIVPYLVPYALGVGLFIGGIVSVPHEEQCNLTSTYHVHLYTRNIGNVKIEKWLQKEKDTFNYIKHDELLPVTSFDLEFYDKLEDYSLFDGRDNLDFIHYQIEKNRDYMEFYYYYEEVYYEKDEEGNQVRKTRSYSGWSNNPRHKGVTGKVRIFHKRYYAYNVIYNNEEFKLQKSEYVDDIREIINEYPYMSENTNIEIYEDFRFSKFELPYLNVEEITPFYTPTVENNPLVKTNKTKTLALK